MELHSYYSCRKPHLPEALVLLEAFSTTEDISSIDSGSRMLVARPDVRQEFFLTLYMGHLQDDLLNATLPLVQSANRNVSDGTM